MAIDRYREEINNHLFFNLRKVQQNTRYLILNNHLLLQPRFLLKFVLGDFDFHSVFRFLAIKSVLKNISPTIDVGASSGGMTIELTHNTNMKVEALVYEQYDVEKFLQLIKDFKINNIRVHQDDAQTLKTIPANYANQLLLIDVLEHVEDDEAATESCYRVLRKDGILIVSVPTPNYPFYFGEEFDWAIGHRRHYTLQQLKRRVTPTGFSVIDHFYYTSKVPSSFCNFIYKKHIIKSRMPLDSVIKSALAPFLEAIALLSEKPSKTIDGHSSLLVVCKK